MTVLWSVTEDSLTKQAQWFIRIPSSHHALTPRNVWPIARGGSLTPNSLERDQVEIVSSHAFNTQASLSWFHWALSLCVSLAISTEGNCWQSQAVFSGISPVYVTEEVAHPAIAFFLYLLGYVTGFSP